MALIVEDGAGLPNAESYVTTLAAGKYLRDRGRAAEWDLLDTPRKEQLLREATDYLTAKYRERWKGHRSTNDQRLDWPRHSVGIDGKMLLSSTIPEEIKNACAELALRASIGTLIEDMSPRVLQETIGPITVKYDMNVSAVVKFTQVEDMLRPLLAGGGGISMKLSRC